MEPTRSRSARDLAAAEARSRPSTQFAEQYPSYPQQAQQLRRPPQQAPAPQQPQQQFTDLLTPQQRPAQHPQQRQPQQVAPPQARLHPAATAAPAVTAVRRLLGVVTFFVLTGLSLPLHVLAVFFVYVQVESPGDTATAAPVLGGMLLAVFAALFVVGFVTQLVGGFPGRWRARITFSFLSAVIALAVAYGAAITQF